jgi:hypothetical protein
VRKQYPLLLIRVYPERAHPRRFAGQDETYEEPSSRLRFSPFDVHGTPWYPLALHYGSGTVVGCELRWYPVGPLI